MEYFHCYSSICPFQFCPLLSVLSNILFFRHLLLPLTALNRGQPSNHDPEGQKLFMIQYLIRYLPCQYQCFNFDCITFLRMAFYGLQTNFPFLVFLVPLHTVTICQTQLRKYLPISVHSSLAFVHHSQK